MKIERCSIDRPLLIGGELCKYVCVRVYVGHKASAINNRDKNNKLSDITF